MKVIDMFAAWQGSLASIENFLFGWLSHIALCGVFSKSGIPEVLTDVNRIS